jgi:exonuclease SbcC
LKLRLRSLEVNNFRAFPNESVTINLDHDVVLFYGQNGVGKTAIFDAIELGITGSLRRFSAVRDSQRVLINARHDTEPASVKVIADDAGQKMGHAQITANGLISHALLDVERLPIFQHTVYLQQSDIRRLVSADSAGLGDVMRTLAVSGEIEKLDRALAEASLSRQSRVYTSAVKSLQERQAFAETLRLQIQADERSLSEVEGIEATVSRSAAEVKQIALKLDAPITEQLDKPSDIREAVAELDVVLQPKLSNAISKRVETDARLRQARQLLEEEREINTSRKAIGDSDARQRLQFELTEATKRVQQCEIELAQPKFIDIANQQQNKILGLIEAALFLADQGICPVCDRPYPDLKDHLNRKIKSLKQAQSELQARYSELQQQLGDARQKQTRAQQDIDRTSRNFNLFESRALEFQKKSAAFLTVYSSDDLTFESALSTETALRTDIEREIEDLSAVAARLSRIRSELEAVSIRSNRITENLTKARLQLNEVRARVAAAEKSKQALDSYVNIAQEARKRTSEGIERVLSTFALGTTKANFEDLFNRLAKRPLFGVTISEARVIRRRPEVHWCATYKEKQYPGDAIFSQGELNSCAMAFFLALSTTNPQSLGFLLLDDPVQNMDEIHIEEFGNILKFIKDQLGRQVIVGLHDESIYHYLKRQMYPCMGAQSLAGYTLQMTDAGTEIVQDVVARFDPKAFIAADVA